MRKRHVILLTAALLLCIGLLLPGCAGKSVPSLRDGDSIGYPGVAWFCTPEELFSALNVSADAATIYDATKKEGDGSYDVTIEGQKLFGEEKGITFSFVVSPKDQELRLVGINIVYDESVDMAKIREKVEASLGPAQEEPTGEANLQMPDVEPTDLSGHVAYWNSKNTITYPNGTEAPARRLTWTDDWRIWRLGTTDTDIAKSGCLSMYALDMPTD